MLRVYLSGLWNEMSEKGRKTLPWDLLRGGFEGAGNAYVGTFALLIAIRYFDCSIAMKSLIASGVAVGQGISFLYATYSHYLIRKWNVEAAIPLFLASACCLACSWVETPQVYAALCFLAAMLFMLRSPAMTAIYRENYKRTVRGQVFSFGVLVGALSSALLCYSGGKFLDLGLERFRVLYFFFGLILLGAAVAVLRIPSERKPREDLPNPFSYFTILKKDPTFVYFLATWFVFGSANLTLLPQRFEYVSQQEYGFALSPGMVALVVTVIPDLVRMLMVLPMGWLFDRMNFIVLRMVINLFFLAYFILFFHATSLGMLMISSALLGIGFAGGAISWNLWVTKFATASDTAKYMAMHTFFTGIRGVLGPYSGYWVATRYSIPAVAWFSVGFTCLSLLMMLPLVPQGAPYDYKRADTPVSEI